MPAGVCRSDAPDSHGYEVPYVFGGLNSANGYTAADWGLAQHMMNYWCVRVGGYGPYLG